MSSILCSDTLLDKRISKITAKAIIIILSTGKRVLDTFALMKRIPSLGDLTATNLIAKDDSMKKRKEGKKCWGRRREKEKKWRGVEKRPNIEMNRKREANVRLTKINIKEPSIFGFTRLFHFTELSEFNLFAFSSPRKRQAERERDTHYIHTYTHTLIN